MVWNSGSFFKVITKSLPAGSFIASPVKRQVVAKINGDRVKSYQYLDLYLDINSTLSSVSLSSLIKISLSK